MLATCVWRRLEQVENQSQFGKSSICDQSGRGQVIDLYAGNLRWDGGTAKYLARAKNLASRPHFTRRVDGDPRRPRAAAGGPRSPRDSRYFGAQPRRGDVAAA